MAEEDLLTQGFTLLVYGMGVVFVFLTLLVGATRTMSALVTRFSAVAVDSNGQAVDNIAPEHVAAIAAALHAHRKSL